MVMLAPYMDYVKLNIVTKLLASIAKSEKHIANQYVKLNERDEFDSLCLVEGRGGH